MTKTVSLTHHYKFPAQMVWQIATDLDHLRHVTKSLMTFRNLPNGQIFEGQNLRVDVSLFGKMPYQPYQMKVVQFDAGGRTFLSSESGAGVKTWRHRLRVVDETGGCRIEESIEIDAGLVTPVFALWARFMYRKRHQPRLVILRDISAKKSKSA